MRLTAMTLNRYGNFDTERVTFDPRPGVLNLLLAPNGGGKSVLRAAFCDLLFGISGQTPMGFRYGYPGMRIAAEAVGPDREPFVFGRRKGQGNTLVDNDGVTIDPAKIARLLGRIDRPRLERLFALDTDRLRHGEADLLASDGELGPALVSGAGGAQDLRALRNNLEERRDALAPARRSSQRPFYAALDLFVDARKRVESSLLRPDQWLKQEQDRAAAEQRQTEQNRIAETESADIARLERVRRVVPGLAAYDTAAAWLHAHPDAPVLDADLASRLAEERSAIVIAEQRAMREQANTTRLRGQIKPIMVDERLLADVGEIDRLIEATGAVRKAKVDLPTVEAQAAALRLAVAARLRELCSPLPIERAADAIPPRTAVSRVRRLTQDYAARHTAAQIGPGQIAELEHERDSVRAQHFARHALGDVSNLEALVREIRADGDPSRQLRDTKALAGKTAESLAATLARVPGWTSGDTALVALAPLLPDTYERHADEVAEIRAEAAKRLEALRSARQARVEAQEHVDSVMKTGSLPDPDALARSRARRDTGWQLIYRRAFTADTPALHEEQGFAGALPLSLAYERAVTAADAVADRHIREAELIERAHTAQAALQDAEARVHDAQTRHDRARQAQEAVERNWRQICSVLPLGDQPTIREVQGFVAARDRVIDARQAHVAAVAAESTLQARHADWTTRLAAMLNWQGEPGLSVLLAEADKRLTAAQQAARDRAALEAKLDAADKALAGAQSRHHRAVAALAEWRIEWAHVMRELRRPEDEDPRVTEDVLQIYADLDRDQKALTQIGERVSGMRRDCTRYTDEAAALARRVAPDLDATDPFLLVSSLRHRAQQAGELATQRDLLRRELTEALKSVALADRKLADSRAALQAILVLVGEETVEAAEHRIGLASERARHAGNLADAEQKLREAGDLRPLAELRTEVAVVSIEEVPGRIEAAMRRRTDAQAAAQDAAAAASALGQQMQQDAVKTGAVDAAADQQSAIATIGRVLEEAVVHHLAAEMLDHALAAVEQQGQSVLLQRIGALFSRLTRGVYSRVLTDVGDDNKTRLILVQRDFPDEHQSVSELSEGTRDQLYLALRLAAIEEHAATAPPLPFIGDDILQTFDDDRALAAMEVLREVSDHVQVILLTHHRHVLELAACLPPGTVHICRVGAAALV